MDGLILVLIGLSIGWFIELILDYVFWQPKRVRAEAETKLQPALDESETANATLQNQMAVLMQAKAQLQAALDASEAANAALQNQVSVLTQNEADLKAALDVSEAANAQLQTKLEKGFGTICNPVDNAPVVTNSAEDIEAPSGDQTRKPVQVLQSGRKTRLPGIPPLVRNATHQEAMAVVKSHVLPAMAVGILPLPLLDFAALTTLQLHMMRRLSQIYEVPFSRRRGRLILTSLLGALLPSSTGRWALTVVPFVPVVGYTISAVAMSSIGGALTYAIGRALIRHFENDKSFLTLRPEVIEPDVRNAIWEGEQVVAELRRYTWPLRK